MKYLNMKRLIQKLPLVLMGLVVLGLAVFGARGARAAGGGNATLYFSPASGSYHTGDTIAVNVYEDSGSDEVSGVEADFSYPASLLTFSSITPGSAWPVQGQGSGGGGVVKIGRSVIITPPDHGLTGPQLVATVRFTVSTPGTANLTWDTGNSYVLTYPGTTPENLTYQNGSYSLSNPPPPPPPPPPGPTPTPGPTPSPSPHPSPPPTPGHPNPSPNPSSPSPSPSASPQSPSTAAISNVKATNVTNKTATITWQTSVPTSSEVDYGLDTNYGITAVNPALVKDHSIALDSKVLLASTNFHYKVKGIDSSNNSYETGDLTFATAAASPAKAKSNTTVVVATVSTLVVIGAGAGAYVWNSRRKLGVGGQIFDPSSAVTSQSSSSAVVTPDKPEVVKPTGKTPPKT
jgi:hypothetical protein